MSFKEKYLKYKNKYLTFKIQYGGMAPVVGPGVGDYVIGGYGTYYGRIVRDTEFTFELNNGVIVRKIDYGRLWRKLRLPPGVNITDVRPNEVFGSTYNDQLPGMAVIGNYVIDLEGNYLGRIYNHLNNHSWLTMDGDPPGRRLPFNREAFYGEFLQNQWIKLTLPPGVTLLDTRRPIEDYGIIAINYFGIPSAPASGPVAGVAAAGVAGAAVAAGAGGMPSAQSGLAPEAPGAAGAGGRPGTWIGSVGAARAAALDQNVPEAPTGNNLLETVLGSITCPICMIRLKKIVICANGHQLCATCTVGINNANTQNCPECRRPLIRANFKVLHQKYLKY
jgi:hypothetical protein